MKTLVELEKENTRLKWKLAKKELELKLLRKKRLDKVASGR